MINESVFFQLLSIGLGLSTSESLKEDTLASLEEQAWLDLIDLAAQQGVLGILTDGISEVYDNYGKNCLNRSISDNRWKEFVLNCSAQLINIENRNRLQIKTMNDLSSIWVKEGCKVMIMKGQANGLYYPNPNHRSPGDIDCFLFKDYEKGNIIAKREGAHVNEDWYKHSEIEYHGEVFENHKYFVTVRDGKSSKEMNSELLSFLNEEKLKMFPMSNTHVPSSQFNACFLSFHSCAHFLYEGLRMKQLLDWAMFLHKEQNNVDWDKFYGFCNRYNLKNFVDAITSICIDKLGLKITNQSISNNDKFSDKIVNSIIHDNDYVYSEGKGKWHNRVHLVKNMFHYRWKFEDVYEQSIWSILMSQLKGVILRTENNN